jgi:hypothetical protein
MRVGSMRKYQRGQMRSARKCDQRMVAGTSIASCLPRVGMENPATDEDSTRPGRRCFDAVACASFQLLEQIA